MYNIVYFYFTEFINEDVLNRCKKGVKIVNVGRGGLIHERSLLNALNFGQVRNMQDSNISIYKHRHYHFCFFLSSAVRQSTKLS